MGTDRAVAGSGETDAHLSAAVTVQATMDMPLYPASPETLPDATGWRDLLHREAPRWRQACWRITRDPALAEDAVQEALLNAWRARAQFRGDAQLGSWIHGIAVRTAIDLMRRRGPLAEHEPDSDSTDCTDGTADVAGPEAHHHRAAMGSDLGRALAGLTEVERVCFVLKHQEQWRLEEIAAHLGRSLDSVKQALVRAVRKLRTRLDHWRIGHDE